MSAFTTDKANQDFELKFTAPAGLLLNVPEPIANKNAVYHQLGTNLAAARRAIEQLQGEEAHAVESGGSLADDIWTAAISTMTDLWTQHKPQEVVPGGTAQNPASKDLRKQWNSNVVREGVRGASSSGGGGPRRSCGDGRASGRWVFVTTLTENS